MLFADVYSFDFFFMMSNTSKYTLLKLFKRFSVECGGVKFQSSRYHYGDVVSIFDELRNK